MSIRTALGVAALLATVSGAEAADATTTVTDLGTLHRISGGYAYTPGSSGDFGAFMSSPVDQALQIDIDLGGVMTVLQQEAFIAVSVVDTGTNIYTASSSGADIDLFTFSGLTADAELEYRYDGSNANHWGESSEVLATRVAELDAFLSATETSGLHYVSLGDEGALTAQLDVPQGIIFGDSGLAGASLGPVLHLSEAGVGESFRIEVVTTAIPAPGALAVLAGLALRPVRRRRRNG